jgi:hypothetical protein
MNKKLPIPAYVLLAFGLLIVGLSNFLSRKFAIPDFATGVMLGMGIAMEIAALCLLMRYRNRLVSK